VKFRIYVMMLLVLGTVTIQNGVKATNVADTSFLKICPNQHIAMADVYTSWIKNLSLDFELPFTPCLNWTEYSFSYIVKGPFVKHTSYNGWKIVGVTYTTRPEKRGILYSYSKYLLNKTLIVARKGNEILIITIYKNVGNETMTLAQPEYHIHEGVMALTLRIVPKQCNGPFGKIVNGRSCPHKIYHNQTLSPTQVKNILNHIIVIFSNENVYNYLNLGLWNVYPPGEIKFEYGKNYAIITPIDTLSTTKQIQIVSNWYYWNDKMIGYGELNFQHAKVTLTPGEKAEFVYLITINEPPNNTLKTIKTVESKIYLAYRKSQFSKVNTTNTTIIIPFTPPINESNQTTPTNNFPIIPFTPPINESNQTTNIILDYFCHEKETLLKYLLTRKRLFTLEIYINNKNPIGEYIIFKEPIPRPMKLEGLTGATWKHSTVIWRGILLPNSNHTIVLFIATPATHAKLQAILLYGKSKNSRLIPSKIDIKIYSDINYSTQLLQITTILISTLSFLSLIIYKNRRSE